MLFNIFLFFKQKTAYEMRISDWSSDVCSSDLARGGASWRDRRLTLTADLSYIGGVDDSRTVPASRVASMTTLDLTARYRTEGSGLTGGLDRKSTRLNSSH